LQPAAPRVTTPQQHELQLRSMATLHVAKLF